MFFNHHDDHLRGLQRREKRSLETKCEGMVEEVMWEIVGGRLLKGVTSSTVGRLGGLMVLWNPFEVEEDKEMEQLQILLPFLLDFTPQVDPGEVPGEIIPQTAEMKRDCLPMNLPPLLHLHPKGVPQHHHPASPPHCRRDHPLRKSTTTNLPHQPHTIPFTLRADCEMPRGRGGIDQGRSQVGTSMLTQVRMPQLAPRMTTHENLSSVDRGFLSCARGPLETQAPEEGQVDLNLIIKRGGYYQYLRDNGYPKHFPLDEHLFPFIQRFTLNDPDADNAAVILEREQLERAILSGRDSMMGTCTFSYLSFPPDYPTSIQFPDVEQLGFFGLVTDSVTKALTIIPAFWEVYGMPKSGFSFPGLSLLPSDSAYTSDDYSQFCLLGQILKESIPSWYDGWSVVSSHRFRLGATEWLMGVLHHYHDLLDHVGIRHAVTAALYSYPCHAGLLQALAERFNRQFNTLATAEGETSIDLWAFHRISGLPICGSLYEEVCLDDLHRDNSKGKGFYHTPYSLRYLTKVWRDLARAGKDETPSACKSSVRVSLHAWVAFFYNGPFCFYNSFAGDTTSWSDYYQLSVEQEKNVRFLPAPKNKGWNPRRLPDRTYLAAYLAYWLSTFVVPYGEDGYIRPEVLYPACALADGVKLALAPVALASIFHGLGNLTASLTPRDRAVVLPTHYLSTWADQAGLNFQHCSWGFRPIAVESPGATQYFLLGQPEAHPSFYKGWLRSVRPSVLVFRKGTDVILEPSYPNRFARNFGYDQATPLNADFPLSTRLYRGSDRHLVAANWWCYYIRRGPLLGCVLPDAERSGQVDIYYARWWFRHSNVFREQLDRIKEAEEKRLCRVDLPSLAISSAFLKQKFPAVDRSLHGSRRKKEGSQKPPTSEKHAYTGALKPLERPCVSGSKGKQTPSSANHYSWWLHLLFDCGYPANAALSSPICPEGFTNELWPHWLQHLKNSIARVGPIEFISQLDNCTRLQDLWDAVSKAGKIVRLKPHAVVLPPLFSPIPDASYVPGPPKKKSSSPRPKKRRAVRAGGASKRSARENAVEDPLPEEP
ncbi:hypothetical protein Taro_045351, partial [Colocasia esculenta]|nr:hypothetical protein [Colocasia esculenta]